MGFGKIIDRLYDICVWIMRLAYINILWIVFSAIGGFLLGLAPSTLAMYSVIRKWVMGEKEIAIFPLFWKSYKEEFFRSNTILLLLVLIGWVLYIDIEILKHISGIIFSILTIIVVSFIIIYIFVSLMIFPVLSHYQFKTLAYFKYTFLIVS